MITTIKTLWGSFEFSEEQIARGVEIGETLRDINRQNYLLTAELLWEADENHLYLIDLEEGMEGAGPNAYKCTLPEKKRAMLAWAESHGAAKSNTTIYEKVRFWRLCRKYPKLLEAAQTTTLRRRRIREMNAALKDISPPQEMVLEWFESMNSLPLDWEAGKQKLLGHPEPEKKAERVIGTRYKGAVADAVKKMHAIGFEFDTRPNKAQIAWIMQQPCCVMGVSSDAGAVHAAHVRTKGAVGYSFCNLIPLHHSLHTYQHQKGWLALAKKTGHLPEWFQKKAVEYQSRYNDYTGERIPELEAKVLEQAETIKEITETLLFVKDNLEKKETDDAERNTGSSSSIEEAS